MVAAGVEWRVSIRSIGRAGITRLRVRVCVCGASAGFIFKEFL